MNQSMLKLFKNKILLTSLFLLFIIIQCKKQEEKKGIGAIKSVKYIGSNQGVRLSKERQQKVFGQWKLTNLIFSSDSKKEEEKIKIDENVIVNAQGVYDLKNKELASKHNTIGTYKFHNLDSLNTVYYIFSSDDSIMTMNSSTLFRVVNGKLTKERARAYLYFSRKNQK